MSKLEDQLFNLKFTARQIESQAKVCKKQEASERARVLKALKENRKDVAEIYAQNAIRNRNQYQKLTAMAAQINAVASRVQSAHQVTSVTKCLGKVVNDLSNASKSLDLEKMSRLMTDFEKQFDNMDVKTSVLDNAMGNTTTLLAPDDEVRALMKESADAANISLNLDMPELGRAGQAPAAPTAAQQEDLAERLTRLRN